MSRNIKETGSMIVVGLMSGTSLDGLDIACCEFSFSSCELSSSPFVAEIDGMGVACRVIAATTVSYSLQWKQRLSALPEASALEYAKADVELGLFFGEQVRRFCAEHNVHADCIASHGHTIFHQPSIGLTTQIANADAIASQAHLQVVSNFRTLDVSLGGQGAPLVPIGDRLLFGSYGACLNLGGIANISYNLDAQKKAQQSNVFESVAYDVCPCNMALNFVASRLGVEYDKDGAFARSGVVDNELLKKLDALEYYSECPPKSLGKEWFDERFKPLIDCELEPENLLCTVVEHIARKVADAAPRSCSKMLVTGGGALNSYLVERISKYARCEVEVPSRFIVDYKEAIVFALLGWLRLLQKPNVLNSVTGAESAVCGGNVSGFAPDWY